MPLYEYLCLAGHRREFLCRWQDAPSLIQCPTCGMDSARVVSNVAFRVAGQTNWKGATMKDVWGDNPLGELDDGINPLRYKSEKPFMDLGKE